MGRDKLLLPWRGRTVIEQVLANLRGAGLQRTWLVTGGRSPELEALASREAVTVVHNPRPEVGDLLGSLQCGLAALPSDIDAVLVLLGDQPMIGPEVMRAVMDASDAQRLREALVVPAHQGRWGHPVLFGSEHLPGLLALPPGSRPRDLLLGLRDRVTVPELEDAPEILADLDTEADYLRWAQPASSAPQPLPPQP